MKLAALAIAGCPIFPASSPWNQRVDDRPVHPRSDAMVQAIGGTDTVHPDFGSGTYEGRPIGIPFQVVAKTQKRSKVTFEYASESDKGPYPIPAKPKIEGGGDRHLLLVQRGRCRLFELFAAERARRRLARGQRRDLQPALEQAATEGLDERRRRRPADPARPRPPGRGRPR